MRIPRLLHVPPPAPRPVPSMEILILAEFSSTSTTRSISRLSCKFSVNYFLRGLTYNQGVVRGHYTHVHGELQASDSSISVLLTSVSTLRLFQGSWLVQFGCSTPVAFNRRSLSRMDRIRERWCCVGGWLSRLDMDTCHRRIYTPLYYLLRKASEARVNRRLRR